MIKIVSGGMLSTIQDLGRFGVMRDGFIQGGAMDSYSFKVANLLCKNPINTPAIEMTVLGARVEFCDSHAFALSGGDFSPTLNGKKIQNNRPYLAKKGDVLALSSAVSGMRCYLAVAGGICGDTAMGSASTDLKIGIGGHLGRKLKAGDMLNIPLFFICSTPFLIILRLIAFQLFYENLLYGGRHHFQKVAFENHLSSCDNAYIVAYIFHLFSVVG